MVVVAAIVFMLHCCAVVFLFSIVAGAFSSLSLEFGVATAVP